jgi:hypothetical protein
LAALSERYSGWIVFDLHRENGAVVECLISDQTMVDMFGASSTESGHVVAAFDRQRADIEDYAERAIADMGSQETRIVLDD